MEVNVLWNFTDMMKKIPTLKQEYIRILASFSIYEGKEKRNYIHETRSKIYSLNLLEKQKDKLWEFMNGDIPYFLLYSVK